MKLSKDEARAVIYGDATDWECMEENIDDTTRWSVIKTGVYKHIPTGKFYSTYWSEGATESQDERAFEHDEPEFCEVEPKEKTIITYVAVKEKG